MTGRLPVWLRQRAPSPSRLAEMKGLLDGLSLHTVCESAECPNQGGCFTDGTVTFLILGDVCTRSCRFCAVVKGSPAALSLDEPEDVARAVKILGLAHSVITSVTRDDLPYGGAEHFASTVAAIRRASPQTNIEVLIPDFQGSRQALKIVIDSAPEVINHNIETVPRLYPEIRPGADYQRSLELLRRVRTMGPVIVTKSGLMLGLGEKADEVLAVLNELYQAGCQILTLGQYLRPSEGHYPVRRYVPPAEFEEYESIARKIGFRGITAAPLVRSSFQAAAVYRDCRSSFQPEAAR
ncbi:lipoyl synthase [Chloroflexota bacterium]